MASGSTIVNVDTLAKELNPTDRRVQQLARNGRRKEDQIIRLLNTIIKMLEEIKLA